jgi:hypothetical protein
MLKRFWRLLLDWFKKLANLAGLQINKDKIWLCNKNSYRSL